MTIDLTPEEIARLFHDTYERLAPEFGYSTRPETRQFDADSINGRLMIRVAEEVLLALADAMEERDEARKAITYATESLLDYDDAEWAAWNAMPAVREALGKDADGND